MAENRDALFLKVAIKNKLLSAEQAEEVLSAQEKRRDIGVERTVQEIVLEKELMTEAKILSIDNALRASLPPDKIAGFKILEAIGKGAVGTVYRAHQLSLDKVVAVKVLHQSLSKNPEYVEQFIREARALGRINHPHVVHGIDAGQEGGYNYFAMELVDGETLRTRLKRQGKLSQDEILAVARAILQGLANAHDNGILHRDLKPDNILLGKNGSVKIGDLGLALPLEDKDILAEEHRRMGSPYYMSPEQAEGKNVDERSDLYALGATLYHASVGKPPFTGQSVPEILKKHVHQALVPPVEAGGDLNESAEAFITKLLEKDPSARPQNARAALTLLEIADKAPAEAAAPARRAPASRRPSPRKAAAGRAAAPAAPPPRAQATGSRAAGAPPRLSDRLVRKKTVFAKVGGGVGALLAIVFVLLGLSRNNASEDTPEGIAREFEQKLVEVDQGKIDQRIKDWNGQIKETEESVLASIQQIEANTDNDVDRLRGLNNLLTQQAKSYAALRVLERIEKIEGAAHQRQVSGAEEAFANAQRLVDEGRLWDGVMLLDKLGRDILTSHLLEQRRDLLIGEIENAIDANYKSDIAKVKQLRTQKDYGQALALLDKVGTYGDPETLKDAEAFRAEIEEQQKTYLAAEKKKRIQEETEKYATFVRRYKDLCINRDFAACISRALELKGEMITEEVAAQLDVDLEAFTLLNKFMNDALALLEKKKGTKEEVTIRLKDGDKRTGGVANVTRKVIHIRLKSGGGTADFPIEVATITDQTIFDLVEAEFGKKSPHYLIPLGVLFTYRGLLDVATEHFNLAAERGVTVEKWLTKLEWMRSQGA